MSRCAVSRNWATDKGGGILICLQASPTITNCVFHANFTKTGGGIKEMEEIGGNRGTPYLFLQINKELQHGQKIYPSYAILFLRVLRVFTVNLNPHSPAFIRGYIVPTFSAVSLPACAYTSGGRLLPTPNIPVFHPSTAPTIPSFHHSIFPCFRPFIAALRRTGLAGVGRFLI